MLRYSRDRCGVALIAVLLISSVPGQVAYQGEADLMQADIPKPHEMHLRLVWPQWQGGALTAYESHVPELPREQGALGYAFGAFALASVLPPHIGPTAIVPVDMTVAPPNISDGIESKEVLLAQLMSALRLIKQHDPSHITTIGGDCSVESRIVV